MEQPPVPAAEIEKTSGWRQKPQHGPKRERGAAVSRVRVIAWGDPGVRVLLLIQPAGEVVVDEAAVGATVEAVLVLVPLGVEEAQAKASA